MCGSRRVTRRDRNFQRHLKGHITPLPIFIQAHPQPPGKPNYYIHINTQPAYYFKKKYEFIGLCGCAMMALMELMGIAPSSRLRRKKISCIPAGDTPGCTPGGRPLFSP